MTKEELIELLKSHRENTSKLALREKEQRMCRDIISGKYDKKYIETSISSATGINADIRSKNQISDKVGNAVVNEIRRKEITKKEAEERLKELEPEIVQLKEKVLEANIRLESLYYKERRILEAYYVDNRTAEDISKNLYFDLFNRTCSPRYIRNIVKESTQRLIKL